MMQLFSRSLTVVVSLITWFFIAIITTLFLLVILLLKPFDRQQYLSYRIPNFWAYLIYKANPLWRIQLTGIDQMQPDTGYVIVANHKSLGDIICIHLLQRHFKWVAKDSLFRIPVIGWIMSLVNYIPLSRGRHGSIKATYREAIRWLNRDVSVVIFPEGTRIKGDKLGPFKNGAFKLAIESQKPVVPVVIKNTGDDFIDGWLLPLKASINIRILPPVDTGGFQPDEFGSLRDLVRQQMEEQYQDEPDKLEEKSLSAG
jgi:1-acyl-sn-glycerol-3-phosphate acyltransferase